MKVSNHIQLTAVLISDDEAGGYMSFLEGMPEVSAQGETEQEALDNLVEAFNFVLQFRKEENNQQYADTLSHHNSRSVQLSGFLAPDSSLEPA